MVQHN